MAKDGSKGGVGGGRLSKAPLPSITAMLWTRGRQPATGQTWPLGKKELPIWLPQPLGLPTSWQDGKLPREQHLSAWGQRWKPLFMPASSWLAPHQRPIVRSDPQKLKACLASFHHRSPLHYPVSSAWHFSSVLISKISHACLSSRTQQKGHIAVSKLIRIFK